MINWIGYISLNTLQTIRFGSNKGTVTNQNLKHLWWAYAHVSVSYASYTNGFPLVAGFISEAQLVFGSRVVQTAEGTGWLTEVPWNHQGAHSSIGGSTGQLGRDGHKVSIYSYINDLLTKEIPLRNLRTNNQRSTIHKSWALPCIVLKKLCMSIDSILDYD